MSAHFSGIECPKCRSIDLKVLETRRQQKAIVRQRECDRRHRFHTVELVADEDGLPSTTPDDAVRLTDEQIMELAKAHTSFNGSHAMTNFVAFARAVVTASE